MSSQGGEWMDIIVGTYDSADNEGIHWYKVDPGSGEWSRAGGIAGIDNPSFVAVHPARSFLYAVSETEDGAVVSYRFDPEAATLAEINRQPSRGDAPCHLSVDRSGRWLLAVNYSTGNVVLYPIGEDGSIGPLADEAVHEGAGPRPDRQEKAHAHSIFPIPGTDDWLACDLGTDGLYVYRLDAARGKLELRSETRATPGSGPRHVAYHPKLPLVYLIEELSSAVSVYRYDAADASLEPLQSLTTLPDGFAEENTCADIHLTASGAYLYASNRGHDSLAVYRVGEDGLLESRGHVSTLGRTPRNFAVIGDEWLLAANQNSDSAVSFRIGEDGIPAAAGTPARIAKPVCLMPVAR